MKNSPRFGRRYFEVCQPRHGIAHCVICTSRSLPLAPYTHVVRYTVQARRPLSMSALAMRHDTIYILTILPLDKRSFKRDIPISTCTCGCCRTVMLGHSRFICKTVLVVNLEFRLYTCIWLGCHTRHRSSSSCWVILLYISMTSSGSCPLQTNFFIGCPARTHPLSQTTVGGG